MDVQFYRPEHFALEAAIRASGFDHYRVGQSEISLSVVDGPFGSDLKVDEYVAEGVPLIRVSNCRTGEIVEDAELVYITPQKHEELIRSEVLPGDVLLTKAGHILGYTAVFPRHLERGNITSHLASIRPAKGVNSKFLALYLTSGIGIAQIYRWGNKATRPELNTDEVRSLLVVLPPASVQRGLVEGMEVARAERRSKLADADQLLNSLDAWVLEQLGFNLPAVDTRQVFAVKTNEVRKTARLNASYFHPERLLTIRQLEKHEDKFDPQSLFKIVNFVRDIQREPTGTYLGLANVQSNTGELVPMDDVAEGSCQTFKECDVLFARLRPYLNKVYRAEFSGVCSTEFHVLRVKNSSIVKPDYLATILRSSVILAQTRHMMTGNTHPRLTNDDVVNLVVPIPLPSVQESISKEVRRRRVQARRLRKKAESDWAEAKHRFEERLLSP